MCSSNYAQIKFAIEFDKHILLKIVCISINITSKQSELGGS